jgi:hypothetical protein
MLGLIGYFCGNATWKGASRVRENQRETKASQGPAWKMLIKTYIAVIPPSGDASGIIEQIILGPPTKPL